MVQPIGLLTVVERFTTIGEAEAAVTALDAGGIEATLFDDEIVTLDWLYSNAVGGIKVVVREEDYDVAADILDFPAEETQEPDGETQTGTSCGERFDWQETNVDETPLLQDLRDELCPRCGSPEIYRVQYRRLKALSMFEMLGLLVIAPWPFLPKRKCDACGFKSY